MLELWYVHQRSIRPQVIVRSLMNFGTDQKIVNFSILINLLWNSNSTSNWKRPWRWPFNPDITAPRYKCLSSCENPPDRPFQLTFQENNRVMQVYVVYSIDKRTTLTFLASCRDQSGMKHSRAFVRTTYLLFIMRSMTTEYTIIGRTIIFLPFNSDHSCVWLIRADFFELFQLGTWKDWLRQCLYSLLFTHN